MPILNHNTCYITSIFKRQYVENLLLNGVPAGGSHYMLLSADLGQGGDRASLYSPTMQIAQNTSLSFHVFLTQYCEREIEQLEIFVSAFGMQTGSYFRVCDERFTINTWNMFTVPLPEGRYSISFVGTLNAGANAGSVGLASVGLLEDSSRVQIELKAPPGKCLFLRCNRNILSVIRCRDLFHYVYRVW